MRKLPFLIIILAALAAQAQASSNIVGCVSFIWTDPNPAGASDAYCFYHSTNSVPLTNYVKIVTIVAGVTNVSINVNSGPHYFYVTCSNWCGEALPSNVATINVPLLLVPATGLTQTSLVHTNGP
jgi:hypothetical protein